MKHYTTIEQSKKLVELGLNPDTADMWWQEGRMELEPVIGNYALHIQCMEDRDYRKIHKPLISPAWSSGALMDLLPPSIQTGEGMQNHYEIDIRKYWGNEENLYQIAYGNNRGLSEEWHDMINIGEKENLIDAVFQMICWLLKNSYIKKGK